MVMALTLEVVMLTLAEVWLLAAAVKLTGFEEALRVPLPPPPPPEPLKLTVIVTGPGTVPPGAVPGPVTITVSFNGSGGGGGGSGTLSASSNPVNLTAADNSQTSANVNITTSSVSAITIQLLSSVTSGGTNWLSTSITNNSLSSAAGTSFTIIANSFNLTPGFAYQGTVTVTPSTGTPLNITVNFSVGGSGSNGTWTASPSTIPWSFTTNSGAFPTQVVSVSTTSGQSLYNVVTTSSNGWLVLFSGVGDVTAIPGLSLIHISEPTRLGMISYAVFCL